MSDWTQKFLDQLQLLYISDKLPKDLAEMYERLPKKKNGTLNMQHDNQACYSFVELAQVRPDVLRTMSDVFKDYKKDPDHHCDITESTWEKPPKKADPVPEPSREELKLPKELAVSGNDGRLSKKDAKKVLNELRIIFKSAMKIIDILDNEVE